MTERYEVDSDSAFGGGDLAQVVSARDRVLDRAVVVKILRPALAADPGFRRAFEAAVHRAGRLSHPNLAPIHDCGETPEGLPFVAFARAGGGSFASLIARPPPWSELVRLIRSALDALAFLHARGQIHRRLKPENLLLHPEGDGGRRVWLADLGLADLCALAERADPPRSRYSAPEQRSGLEAEIGPATDLFALGGILWEIATGGTPFGPGAPYRPAIAAPAGLEAVLGNLLAVDPLARYDLAADVRAELETLASAGLPGRPAPRGEDVEARVRWRRPSPPPIPAEPPPEAALERSPCASFRMSAGREIPLAGRESEVGAIWQIARQITTERRARVVVVVGEAGSGRTRLLRSVTRRLEEGGHAETVWMAYGDPPTDGDGTLGAARGLLRPWCGPREALEERIRRRLLRESEPPGSERPEPPGSEGPDDLDLDGPSEGADPSPEARIGGEAAALARWCEEGPRIDRGEQVPHALGLREIFRHLEARSWRGLGCLVLDDPRWAAEPGDGLDLVESFVERDGDGTPSSPLMILASIRSEDLAVDVDLAARIGRWVDRGALRIDLSPLGPAEAEALVGEDLPADLRARILARCGGNPLLARQLVLGWVDREALVPSDHGPGFVLRRETPIGPIPEDLASAVEQRLSALAERSGHRLRFIDLAHLLALAGRAVPAGLAAGFAGPELEAFALGCGLWVEEGDRLGLESTAVHRHLASAAARRPDAAYLHRRLARAWGRGGRGPGAAMGAGLHGILARDPSFAAPWLLRAAEGCWARDRVGGLASSSRLAIEAADADPALGSLRGGALLCGAHAAAALRQDASALYAGALEALRASRDLLPSIEALLGLATSRLRAGDADAAEAAYTEAVDRAREASSPRLEVRAIAGKGRVALHRRAFEAADIQFGRAVARALQLSDPRTAGEALLGQAFVARRTGRLDEAEELYDEARGTFRPAGHLPGEVWAVLGLGAVSAQRDPTGSCEQRFAEAADLAQRLGASALLAEARLGIGAVARHRRERERAERIYQDCAALAARTRSAGIGIASALGRARLALDHQELTEAYEQTTLAAKWLSGAPGHWLWADYRLVVATLLAHRRDHTHTWQWLWSAQEVGLGEVVDREMAYCLISICEVAAEAGWANVVRLAGKIGAEQLARLNDPAGVSRLKQRVATALL